MEVTLTLIHKKDNSRLFLEGKIFQHPKLKDDSPIDSDVRITTKQPYKKDIFASGDYIFEFDASADSGLYQIQASGSSSTISEKYNNRIAMNFTFTVDK